MKDSSKTLFLLFIIFSTSITGCNERLYIGEYDGGYKYDYLYPIDISHYDDGYDTEEDLYDKGLDVLSEDYSYYETIGDMGELDSYDEGFYNDIENVPFSNYYMSLPMLSSKFLLLEGLPYRDEKIFR